MSNWGWLQWVILVLLLFGIIGNICLAVEDSKKTLVKMLEDGLRRKEQWKQRIVLSIVLIYLELFVLAKGGFFG